MTRAIHGCTITTTNYFSHFIPRKLIGCNHNGTTVLHSLPAERCANAECSTSALIISIETSWPQILHIVGSSSDGLGDIEPAFTIPDGRGGSISYQFVGRVIHKTNHFVSQVVVAGRTYYYDDISNNGKLQDMTPADITAAPSTLLVYHHTTGQVRFNI